MPGDYSDLNSPHKGPGGPLLGTMPLRIASAGVLLYLHTWQQAQSGWFYLWHQKPWDLPLLVAKVQFPYPDALAIAAALIAFTVTVSWLLGFLTRLFSVLFIPVLLGVLLGANRLEEYAAAEAAMLYVFISLTLVISGSGWFSVDKLFVMNRNPRRSPRRKR